MVRVSLSHIPLLLHSQLPRVMLPTKTASYWSCGKSHFHEEFCHLFSCQIWVTSWNVTIYSKMKLQQYFLSGGSNHFLSKGFINLHCIIEKNHHVLILTQKVRKISHRILMKSDVFFWKCSHFAKSLLERKMHPASPTQALGILIPLVPLQYMPECFFPTFYRLNFVHQISKVLSQ